MFRIATLAAVLPLGLALSGCVVTDTDVAVSEPDPELAFVRGYRGPGDDCRLVGETAFTVDFLDDAADLVACSTGSSEGSSVSAT